MHWIWVLRSIFIGDVKWDGIFWDKYDRYLNLESIGNLEMVWAFLQLIFLFAKQELQIFQKGRIILLLYGIFREYTLYKRNKK